MAKILSANCQPNESQNTVMNEDNAEKELLEALRTAHRTIFALHGEIAWPEYQHSPEMKKINGALRKYGTWKQNLSANCHPER